MPQGASIDSRTYADLLSIQFNKVFSAVGDERPREYPRWINVGSLESATETTKQVSGLGTMGTKPEGQAPARDTIIEGGDATASATAYGSIVELYFEALQDEQYSVFDKIPAMQARSGREREEVAAAVVLNEAFNTAFDTGFTAGEALCGNHVGLDGVTRRNRPTNPIGFSITGLQAGILHFHNLTNERGLKEYKIPSQLLIHPNNIFAAREILGSPKKAYTANNEINSLEPEDLQWLALHFLESTTAWFMLASMDEHNLQMKWRNSPRSSTFGDPHTMNVYHMAYQRHTDGYWQEWRGVYGDSGA